MHNLFDAKKVTITAATAATGVKSITNIISSDQEELVDDMFSNDDDDDDDDDEDDDDDYDDDDENRNVNVDGNGDMRRNEIDMLSDGIPLDCDDTEDLVSISLIKSSIHNANDNRSPHRTNNEQHECDCHVRGNCQTHQSHHHRHQNANLANRKTFICLIVYGLGLMATSFGLIVILPLYQNELEKQLSTDANSFGTILFTSPIITLLLALITLLSSSKAFKWKWHIMQLPSSIPIKRLMLISIIFGVSSAIILICSYKRVACHLQDPLKGTALAFSLVLYFLLCKRVMGLKKIFATTTAVVGLFISLDYGLCDEFHCHGNVISYKGRIQSTGWQGRAFWALAYTIGIFFWTLHVALLEECFVTGNEKVFPSNENNFLKTISKFVASTDIGNDRNHLIDEHFQSSKETIEMTMKHSNQHPLHLAMWVHLIGTIVAILIGSVDILPVTGSEIKSFRQHWKETKLTFVCHLGIGGLPEDGKNKKSEPAMDVVQLSSLGGEQMPTELDNIVATLESYQLHKNHRTTTTTTTTSSNNNNNNNNFMRIHNENHNKTKTRKTFTNSKNISHMNAFQKYKNATSNHMPSMSGKLENVGHKKIKLDCSHHCCFYVWLLICTYAGFVVCLFNFLNLTKSAVFTVSMTTAILPFIGLFWSFFKLETQRSLNAVIIWSPSVSGELICSILGIPIVFVGIIFLFKSHYNDMTQLLLDNSSVSCDP